MVDGHAEVSHLHVVASVAQVAAQCDGWGEAAVESLSCGTEETVDGAHLGAGGDGRGARLGGGLDIVNV